jgi:hypothetical protein
MSPFSQKPPQYVFITAGHYLRIFLRICKRHFDVILWNAISTGGKLPPVDIVHYTTAVSQEVKKILQKY